MDFSKPQKQQIQSWLNKNQHWCKYVPPSPEFFLKERTLLLMLNYLAKWSTLHKLDSLKLTFTCVQNPAQEKSPHIAQSVNVDADL
jgi:hypothetical protein